VFFELYKIPQDNMVYNENLTKAFLKGKDIVKIFLKYWDTFKRRSNLDYPIFHFRMGFKIGMLLLNRLYGATNTDHMNQYWVPLLGEIIMSDRKQNLLEVLSFNFHEN